MKENEQIIWNSLFLKQNIQNYLIIEPTCPKAKVIVYFGEYYSFCIFGEKHGLWLSIIYIHEVIRDWTVQGIDNLCKDKSTHISSLLFWVSFVNSLLILHCDTLSWHHLSWDPLFMGHNSKSNLRVSCTKENKNWRRKEVKYTKDVVWHGKCDLEFLGQLWKVKAKKNVQQYFTKSSHYPLKMDGTTSPFGVSEVV